MKLKYLGLVAAGLIIAAATMFLLRDDFQLTPYADVTDRSLVHLDLSNQEKLLETLMFSQKTQWPDAIPQDFNPVWLMEWGKNPGLGVKGLHASGITGDGVPVAVIDKALNLEHQEYRHALQNYTAYGKASGNLSHGPAVMSILAGRECGVAPGARVHYYANSAKNYSEAIAAVEDVLAYNAKSSKDKIRIISISRGFQDQKDLAEWQAVVEKAWAEGVMLLHPDIGWIFGIGCKPYANRDDPNAYGLCIFLAENNGPAEWAGIFPEALYFPVDNRTYAYWQDTESYTFEVRGGSSWAVPYAAGVLALGLQAAPELSNEQLIEAMYATATPWEGGKIVNPAAFIDYLLGQ